NLTGIPFLGVMGNVAAVSVTVAVLVAVTFTPAVLGPMGEKVLSRAERTDRGNGGAGAEPVEAMGTLRAALLVVATIAVLLVIAVPATSMRLGLPDGSAEPEGSTQYQAYATIAEAFGEGHNGPLVVAADLPEAVEEQEEWETQLALG